MRKLHLAVVVSLVVAACTDAPTGPTSPLDTAPTIRLTHLGSAGESTSADLCDGFSPCDAYTGYYHGDASDLDGFCFVPPMVDNHLSDPDCAGDLRTGLEGIFFLTWCEVTYDNASFDAAGFPEDAPEIVSCPGQRRLLTEDGTGYSASVRFGRGNDGKIFRLYVIDDADRHYAFRDVVVDPNTTHPSDDYVHSIGWGNEPVKVRITDQFSCLYFDTQQEGTNNAATCPVSGRSTLGPFLSDVDGDSEPDFSTTFDFYGTQSFLAEVVVSECLSLTDGTGIPLVDVPLGGCAISLSAGDLAALDTPGTITLDLLNGNPFPFADARPNVLQYDEAGVAALPPSAPAPSWLGVAESEGFASRLLDWGVDKLRDVVAFFGPQPVYAWPGSGWDFTRLSEFQIAWMSVMWHGTAGDACASEEPSCRDIGTFEEGDVRTVTVNVTAPSTTNSDPTTLAVEGTRLHVFEEDGTVACPASPGNGQTCLPIGHPDNTWANPARMVILTGSAGTGIVDWTLGAGDNRLNFVACGVATPGDEPNPSAEPGLDGVWGALTPIPFPPDDPQDTEGCVNRYTGMTQVGAFNSGPAEDLSPFEPAHDGPGGPFGYETAIYGLPLVYEAHTCPTIDINGIKGDGEWDCADVAEFTVNLQGPKGTSPNAFLRTYNDGDALYVSLEVIGGDIGNRVFLNVVDHVQSGSLVQQGDDDVLILDFPTGTPGVPADWYYTSSCVGNNAASLCGAPDTGAFDGFDAAAGADGAGEGRLFIEFERPFSGNFAEDLDVTAGLATGKLLGLRATMTQGQGGGKGGFVIPATGYHEITLH